MADVSKIKLDNTVYNIKDIVARQQSNNPVVIWETGSSGLTAIDSDITASPNWQLTNLDFSPYKRVKIYAKAGQKSSGIGIDASVTPAVVLEMSLDSRAAGPVGGHYLGSYVGQKPNDANRLFTITCAISADKTSFVVLRMTSLYGTGATSNSDVNGYVFKIEGYYDQSNTSIVPITGVTNTLSSGVLIATVNGVNIYAPSYANGDNISY